MSNFKNLTPFMPSFSSKRVLEVTSASATQSNYDADLKELGVAQHSKVASNQIASHTQKYDFVIFNLDVSALGDEEFLALAEAALSRLEPDGSLFFSASVNGEKSRSAITYIDLAQMKAEQENGTQYGFELAFAKPFSSDPNSPSLYNNVAYLLKKQKVENYHGYKSLKEFMDHKQYSRNGVIRYEVIFGAGFVSTGGIDTTTEFLKELNLKPGQKVLDVGCGIGGGDFLMAEKYGVDVLGIDLASNMIGIAWERAPQHKNLNVRFEIGDVTKQIFPDDYFDLIYSRDTILHIKDKESLFAQFKKWLKPGGRVFITDYCAGPRDKWSSEFAAYVEQRGYDLRTVDQYGAIFTSLGFANVRALDRTDLFVQSLKNELTKMAEIKEKFVSDFSLDDFNYLVDGWNAKLVRCVDGNQVWGYFYCEK